MPSSVARSRVSWDTTSPPVGDVWQLRVPTAVAMLGKELGLKNKPQAPLFREWADLTIAPIANTMLPRTIILGTENFEQPLERHTLSGDFRLSRERYGCRP